MPTGVALTGAYIGGNVAGTYTVTALVSAASSERNAEIMGLGGDPIAHFSVNQFAAPTVVSVPASSMFALGLLAFVIVLMSCRRLTRLSPGGIN